MDRAHDDTPPLIAFVASVVATLTLFRLLTVVVSRLSALPPLAYTGRAFVDDLPARAWSLAARHTPWWLVAAAVAAVVVVAVLDSRQFGGAGRRRVAGLAAGWNAVDDGAALRLLVMAITGITTWALTTYARNLYVDQLHLADRLLLLALWLAIAWRPLFALPYAIVAGAVAGQFTVPLGFISWTEMGVLLHLPVLLIAFWAVRSATGSRRSDVFVLAWCCLVAVTFWTSGLGKLRIDWFGHPHVSLLMLGAYANGWLAFLDAESVVRAANALARATWPMMVLTLVLECGALVVLWRRWSLLGFLMLEIGFHVAVFAMTGICFWKWVAADAALFAYLMSRERLQRLALFTPGRFVLSLAVIVSGPLWIRAENLTWLDTPLTYSLRFVGVDEAGATHPLVPAFFRPFGDAIVLGTFPAVSPYPQLTRGMGVTTDRPIAEALLRARTAEEVFALEARLGTARFNSPAAAAFDDFVARTAANARCDAERDPALLRLVGAPRHLWTFPLAASLPCATVLSRVTVVERTRFFDGARLRVIRERVIRVIDVTRATRTASGTLHDGGHGTTKETEQRLETTPRFGLRAFARDALTPGDHVDLTCPIIDLVRTGSEHAGTLGHGAFDLYRLAVVLLWPVKQISDAHGP